MLRPVVRTLALVIKELLEVFRQPNLVLALILGPFLVLFVFGIGHRSQRPPLSVILVIPPNLVLARDPGFWLERFGPSARVVDVTDDPAAARAAVELGRIDLALLIPADAYDTIARGSHPELLVLDNQIDPIERAYVRYLAYVLSAELNKQAIAEIIRQAQSRTPPEGEELRSIPPDVLAAPFVSRLETVASVEPDFVSFFSPGVLALLLQHLAITLTALSLVRERLLGTTEIYQVAPTSSLAVLVGKYLSYALLGFGIAAALTGLMTQILDVPLAGDLRFYWGTIALMIFASLGIGLTISLVSGSQEQAVQFAMIVLLASVFFSGFFLSLETLQFPATAMSAVLPVTYGIIAFQDLMLRGNLRSFDPLFALGGIGFVFLILSAWLLHRELGRR